MKTESRFYMQLPRRTDRCWVKRYLLGGGNYCRPLTILVQLDIRTIKCVSSDDMGELWSNIWPKNCIQESCMAIHTKSLSTSDVNYRSFKSMCVLF